jgi:hypothetical protein
VILAPKALFRPGWAESSTFITVWQRGKDATPGRFRQVFPLE